ncbi:hypothetical protein [Fimbriiglobus ruber]|uniref:hypothetical protein n=1 Tax=Fimbriiglobus ruber TaxID=1908690 RepID=UPI000B4A810E|nr:hypothetical protein [Fimbriiglobus ruber]
MGELYRPLAAQPAAKPPEAARYQISSWGYSSSLGGGALSERGAYIVDTQTGEVFAIVGDQKPRSIGKVGAKE